MARLFPVLLLILGLSETVQGQISQGTWNAAEQNKFQLWMTVSAQGQVTGAYLKVYFDDGWLDSQNYEFNANDITLSGSTVLAEKVDGVLSSSDSLESYQITGTFQPDGTLTGTWKSTYYVNPIGLRARSNAKEGGFTATNDLVPATVTTTAASGIAATSATLNGTVNPNGATTTAKFEYGLSTAYDSVANVTLSPANGATVQTVSASISVLQAGQTYHYRLTASRNGVTSIGYAAFAYCTGLTSVSIPSSVVSIGDYAFYGCTGLTTITVAAGNPA